MFKENTESIHKKPKRLIMRVVDKDRDGREKSNETFLIHMIFELYELFIEKFNLNFHIKRNYQKNFLIYKILRI